VKKVVRFCSGGAEYALPVEQTRQVRRIDGMTPLPSARPEVSGLLELDGGALTVFSPLGGGQEHVLIVEKDDGAFGVLVDEVWGVEDVNERNIGAPPRGQGPPFISGVLSYADSLVLLIDGAVLAQSLDA
jgi:chemotaxis signal transduction protein